MTKTQIIKRLIRLEFEQPESLHRAHHFVGGTMIHGWFVATQHGHLFMGESLAEVSQGLDDIEYADAVDQLTN